MDQMKNLDETTANGIASTIKGKIAQLLHHYPQRPPGSVGEEGCQKYLYKDLVNAAIDAKLESFPVAQKAFMAMPAVCSWLALLGIPLYWITPRLSPLPILLALIVLVFELLFYKHILTPLFPKSTSYNLIARVPAAESLQQRILLVGHVDAAFEWRFLRWCPWFFPVIVFMIASSVAYLLITTMAAAITGGVYTGNVIWQWIGLTHALVLPGLSAGIWFTNFDYVSPGAADNLSGTLCATELLQWMKKNNLALNHTEIVVVATGSEEAGLVGSRAYLDVHYNELKTVPTIAVAVDTIAELDYLAIYNRDLNGRVHHDVRVCELLRHAGITCGLKLNMATITLGSSDATSFTQAGIPAAALCAMNPAPAHYYHNRRDTVDAIEDRCLAKTIQLLFELCRRYDAEGIASS